VPCVSTAGTSVTLYAASATTPTIARLAKVGTRYAGGGPDLDGLVTFDLDGGTPQATPSTIGADTIDFDGDGTNLHMAGIVNTAVLYARFDGQGNRVGDPIQLAKGLTSAPQAIAIATSPQGSLVVWGAGSALHAIGVGLDGTPAGPVFDFAPGSWHTQLFTAVAYDGTNFVIGWTGDPNNNPKDPTTRSSIVSASLTATVGAPIDITTAANVFQLIKLRVIPNGYLVVYNGLQEDEIYVVPLDKSGKPTGPAHRFLGADYPADLAINGNEAGLLILSKFENDAGLPEYYRPQFRRIDLTGKPLDAWVCLTTDFTNQTAAYPAALLVEATGYASVFRGLTNEDVFMRFDHLGTGAP
jgi:hypothetical protein